MTKKIVFLDAIVFVLRNYYCFLLEKQIFKSCKWERLRDPVARRPGDQMIRRSGDVRGLLVIYVFKIQLIKLTLTGYSRLYSELC